MSRRDHEDTLPIVQRVQPRSSPDLSPEVRGAVLLSAAVLAIVATSSVTVILLRLMYLWIRSW